MNLTDILLFGRTILGDRGSSDAVKPILDVDLEYLEEDDKMYYFELGEIQLVEGTFYMVTLGDSVYTVKARRYVDEEEPDFFALYLGNAAIEDYGFDTGEPFFYVEQTYKGESERLFSATNGASHVTITKTESSGGGSDDSGGEYKQMSFIVPTGSKFVRVSEIVPDMIPDSYGVAAVRRADDALFSAFYHAYAAPDDELGMLVCRLIDLTAEGGELDVYRFAIEESAGFFVMSDEPVEYDTEVNIFWKNP